MRSNLFEVVSRLEQETGRRITQAEIARESGVSRITVHNLWHDSTNRIDFGTAEQLIGWFRDNGLDVTMADLFPVEKVEG